MREIKFRAYVKEKSLLAKVDQIFFDSKYVSIWDIKEQYMLRLDFCKVELMQYTGFKDKAGLEVYEGDIIMFDNNIFTSSPFLDIEFRKSTGKIAWDDSCYRAFDSAGKHFVWCDELIESMEVIGNIHENPELLVANEGP